VVDAETIFATSIDLVLVVNKRGLLQRVSPSSELILGYKPEEMVGNIASKFLYHRDLESTRQEMREARKGKTTRHFPCRYMHKNGRVVPLMWSGVWVEEDQQHVFFGRDMSSSQQLDAIEQQLELVNRRLRLASVVLALRRTDVPVVEAMLALASIWACIVLALPPSNFAAFPKAFAWVNSLEDQELFWSALAGVAAFFKVFGLLMSERMPNVGGLFRCIGLAASGMFWVAMAVGAIWGNPDTLFAFCGLMWGILSWWSLLRVPW